MIPDSPPPSYCKQLEGKKAACPSCTKEKIENERLQCEKIKNFICQFANNKEAIAAAKTFEFSLIKKLDVSKRELEEIPPEIRMLVGLMNLNLSTNYLSELPKDMICLKNLKTVNLSGNKFNVLPHFFLELKEKSLKQVILFNNDGIEIPLSCKDIIETPYPFNVKWIPESKPNQENS
jgi:Leucine-rich repeat (LRR) protein